VAIDTGWEPFDTLVGFQLKKSNGARGENFLKFDTILMGSRREIEDGNRLIRCRFVAVETEKDFGERN
jgi:hypothetical protein